jgi:putative ABC transport system permease protein
MVWMQYIEESLLNLYHAKLRTFLALLGILVGSAAVVAMVLGGQLATQEALQQFKSLGTDLLAVTLSPSSDEKPNSASTKQKLTLPDVNRLAIIDKQILNLAPYTQLFLPMYYHDQPLTGMVIGVTQSFADVVRVQIKSGRFIYNLDGYSSYCVIGQNIYQSLKKTYFQNPIGQPLQVGDHVFIIVGVAERWPENNFVYANIDDAILIPILTSTILSQYATISNIILRLAPHTPINKLEAKMQRYFQDNEIHQNITFRSAKELIKRMRNQSNILTVFLGLIGSVSLVVGGIGVMNIMLVSVMERRREIGIRLAVGAKRRDIGVLFLLEAILLSIVGGTLGVLIGILIAYIIASIWHWQFSLFLWPPIAGFSISVLVGIFFGFYPAYLAAKLNPIDALRAD